MENEAERQNYELEAERVRQEMNARLSTSNEGISFFFHINEGWEFKKYIFQTLTASNSNWDPTLKKINMNTIHILAFF